MRWRDRLQPGSYRGVRFEVDRSSGSLGRRNAVHEYPGRDRPWVEDTGRRTREFSEEVFVIGTNYDVARNALIAAIEQEGPGELVHPKLGAMRVSMTDGCRWSESTREGGMAKFTLDFIESGEAAFPLTQIDTVAAVDEAVNSGLTAVQSDFNSAFTVDGLPGWVAASSGDLLSNGLNVLGDFVPQIGGGLDSVFAATQGVKGLLSDVTGLLPNPALLAGRLADVMGPIIGGSPGINGPLALVDKLAGAVSVPSLVALTPSRVQQALNHTAIGSLVTNTATLLATKQIAKLSSAVGVSVVDSPFNSRQHALSVRTDLVGRLETLASSGSDALFDSVRTLTPALVKHVDAHGFGLASAVAHTPLAELPALVMAHQLYGDAGAEQDLIIRNGIRNPGAVAAGYAMEVLSNV